jgi:hypothetical protein
LLSTVIFFIGLAVVIATFFSALSTFVLPRAARSELNRLVFGILRRIIEIPLRFTDDYRRRDSIMAYYAPIGLMLLVPTWYALVSLGYTAMYWGLGYGSWFECFRLSGSSLLTLGFESSTGLLINILVFSEAILGLILVALLIAYLPSMYSAFSRREQSVNLLAVRAGDPPSAIEMILRFNRIHGLDRLDDYWKEWEIWFADIEETHTVLPALVFFRSPKPEHSWVIAAGTVLDAASITLSSLEIPYNASAALCIRAGFLALRSIIDYFDIPYPVDPHFPETSISISKSEFESALDRLAEAGVPVKNDRDQAWMDYAGWRVNYDRTYIALCNLTMAPKAMWSGDRPAIVKMPPLMVSKK